MLCYKVPTNLSDTHQVIHQVFAPPLAVPVAVVASFLFFGFFVSLSDCVCVRMSVS